MKAILIAIILTLILTFQMICQSLNPTNAPEVNVVNNVRAEQILSSRSTEILLETKSILRKADSFFEKALNPLTGKQLFESEFFNHKNTKGDLHKTVFASLFLEKEFTQQVWNVSDWEDSSRSLKTYDENLNNDTIVYQIFNDTNWVNSKRTLNDYDVNNNLIEAIDQIWDGSVWLDSSKTSHLYDTNNNLIELLTQNWDGSAWINYIKISNIYDSNNNLIEQLFQYWDGSSEWINLLKTLNTYVIQNNLTEQLVQFWVVSSWENYSLTINTYDVNNNQIESLSQLWNGSNWVNSRKTSNTYDSNNNLIEMLSQIWDGSNWVNSNRFSNSYDINNNLIESVSQSWDGSIWVNSHKTTNTYNSNNNPVETVDLNWDSTQSQWLNDKMRIYTYDSDNNLIEVQILEGDGSGWLNNLRFLYVWEQVIPIELISFTAQKGDEGVVLDWSTATETNNQGFEVERQVGSRQSAVGNSVWEVIGYVPGFGTTTEPKSYSYTDSEVLAGKYIYRLKQIDLDGSYEYSNEVEVDITAPLEFALEQNYPNPFNPSTTIKYSIPELNKVKLTLFNLLGEEVTTLVNEEKNSGNYSVEFNATTLPSGVYFYQLKAGDFISTKKMILLR